MKCEDFNRTMHRCIDDRIPFASEEGLVRHARRCPSCRGQLQAWLQIATILPDNRGGSPYTPTGESRFRRASFVSFVVGVAAVWMLVLVTQRPQPASQSPVDPVDSSSVAIPDLTSQRVDATHWWNDVRGRDWMAQTIPTVRNVRDGVAPLGRSILQAVSILTTGGGEQTS